MKSTHLLSVAAFLSIFMTTPAQASFMEYRRSADLTFYNCTTPSCALNPTEITGTGSWSFRARSPDFFLKDSDPAADLPDVWTNVQYYFEYLDGSTWTEIDVPVMFYGLGAANYFGDWGSFRSQPDVLLIYFEGFFQSISGPGALTSDLVIDDVDGPSGLSFSIDGNLVGTTGDDGDGTQYTMQLDNQMTSYRIQVPAPATYTLICVGLAGLLIAAKKRI
jgi:hypothetical protein